MAKALLIAEKNSARKSIEQAVQQEGFKDDITFVNLSGHCCGIMEPDKMNPDWAKWRMDVLPMIPAKFEFEIKNEDLYERVRAELMSGKYDYVINATDPEREGQLIFYAAYNLSGSKLPVKRFWTKSLMPKDVMKALNEMKDDQNDKTFKNLTAAAFLRAYSDWLIGMNGTRAVSIKNGTVLRIGRVMTATLNIIVMRELAIRNFVQKTSYDCLATFGSKPYTGFYNNPECESISGQFESKNECDTFIKSLPKTGIVKDVDVKTVKEYPDPLYTTDTIMQDANRAFGYTMSEVLEGLQQLYEAKLTTYPRTDCAYITEEIADSFEELIQCTKNVPECVKFANDIKPSDIEKTRKDPKYVNDKKVEAHTGIILTGKSFNVDNLSPLCKNLIVLISKRIVALFMEPLIKEKTIIETDVGGHIFRTNGSVLINMGYTSLYGTSFNVVNLPKMKKGETVTVESLEECEKVSQPPTRYNDDLLGKAMIGADRFVEDIELKKILKGADKKDGESGHTGIGTPATRAGILDKLVNKYKTSKGEIQFVERKGTKLIPTDIGIELIQALDGCDIISPILTAQWEKKLSMVQRGTLTEKEYMDELIVYVKKETDSLKSAKLSSVPNGQSHGGGNGVLELVGAVCPLCKGRILESEKGYFCENVKREGDNCPFMSSKVILSAKISKDDFIKICNGQESSLLKMTKKDKSSTFEAVLQYDANKREMKFKFPERVQSQGTVMMECPKCKKDLVKIDGKFGPYFTCGSKCYSIAETAFGHRINKKELKELMSGKQIGPFENLIKKDGGKFSASLEIGTEGKIKPVFAPRK